MTDELAFEPAQNLEGPIKTTGTIAKIELRDVVAKGDNVTYADLFVEVDHSELSTILGGAALKVGFPFRVHSETKLGALLKRFGQNIEQSGSLTPLIGQKVAIVCDKEPGSDGGMYWRIDRDTMMPAE